MKRVLIILILLLVIVFGSVLLYNKLKKGNTSIPGQTTPDTKRAEYLQKRDQFNNTMQTILSADNDADGLSNNDETKYGTDPKKADTDGDGLLDKDEVSVYHTNPLKTDTDGDGFSDFNEVRNHTSPLDPKIHPTK